MIQEGAKVCVVYLAWLPYGIQHFRDFIQSYKLHAAGWPHDLVIVFNGTALPHEHRPDDYIKVLQEYAVQAAQTFSFEQGQDIEIYSQMAGQLEHDHILFLNTYSIILADHWLKFYAQGWQDDLGVLSATGSLQSYYSSVFVLNKMGWQKTESLSDYFRKMKLLIKASVYWRFLFDAFPNHHVRTNAFFVNRKEFAEIAKAVRITSKFDAYLFESGKKGMTRSFEKRGKSVAILTRQGKVYRHTEWAESQVFRSGSQEQLLISDNQTREYELASPEEKKLLTRLTWGIHG